MLILIEQTDDQVALFTQGVIGCILNFPFDHLPAFVVAAANQEVQHDGNSQNRDDDQHFDDPGNDCQHTL